MRKSLRSLLGYESEQNSIQSSPSQQITCNKFSKIRSREKRKNDSYKYARERLIEHYKRLIKQTDLHQLPVISYGAKKANENIIEIQRHPRWDKQSQSQEMLDSRYTDQGCSRIDFTKREEDEYDCKFSKYPTIFDDPEQQQKKSLKSVQKPWQEVCANKQSPKLLFHEQTEQIETFVKAPEPFAQKSELIKFESAEKIAPEPVLKDSEPVASEQITKAPEQITKASEQITKAPDPITKAPESTIKIVEPAKKPPEPMIKPIEPVVESAIEKVEINPFTQSVANPLFSAPWLMQQPVQQIIPTQQSFNLFQQEPIPQQMQVQQVQQFPIQESVFPFQQQNAFNQQPFPQQPLFNNENLFPQQNLFNNQQQPQQNLFIQQQSLFPNQQTNFQDPSQQQNLFGQQQPNLFTQPQQQNLFPQQQNAFTQPQQQNLFAQQQQNQFPQQQNLFPQPQQPNPFGNQSSNLFQFQTTQLGGGSFSADDQKHQIQAAGLFQAGADLFQQQESKNTQSQISADRYKNKMRNNNQQRLG